MELFYRIVVWLSRIIWTMNYVLTPTAPLTIAPDKSLFKDCMYQCVATAISCEQTAANGLMEKNVQEFREWIALARDCADLCWLTSAMMARNSAHAPHLAKECAKACERCMKACERFEHTYCADLARTCRSCMQSCKVVAGYCYGIFE